MGAELDFFNAKSIKIKWKIFLKLIDFIRNWVGYFCFFGGVMFFILHGGHGRFWSAHCLALLGGFLKSHFCEIWFEYTERSRGLGLCIFFFWITEDAEELNALGLTLFILHESHESARIFFLAIRCQFSAISFYHTNLHFRFRKWDGFDLIFYSGIGWLFFWITEDAEELNALGLALFI